MRKKNHRLFRELFIVHFLPPKTHLQTFPPHNTSTDPLFLISATKDWSIYLTFSVPTPIHNHTSHFHATPFPQAYRFILWAPRIELVGNEHTKLPLLLQTNANQAITVKVDMWHALLHDTHTYFCQRRAFERLLDLQPLAHDCGVQLAFKGQEVHVSTRLGNQIPHLHACRTSST